MKGSISLVLAYIEVLDTLKRMAKRTGRYPPTNTFHNGHEITIVFSFTPELAGLVSWEVGVENVVWT
jgi:hypothetical protein